MAEHASYFIDEKSKRAYMTKQVILKVLVYLFLSIFAIFMLIPFILMIVGSFVNPDDFQRFTNTGNFSYLSNLEITSFNEVFKATVENARGETVARTNNNFAAFFLNTAIVAVGSTTVTVVTAVLAAFAFARLEFKGREVLFAVLLGTMMIPGEMMVITNFSTVIELDWKNTFAALILVHGVSVFYIFYLRQTFQQIPNELYLAAKVDGVGDIGYLFKVMIPIAMPTITTIIILSLMGSWNSYIWPNLVADGSYKYNPDHTMLLVSNGLRKLFAEDVNETKDAVRLAGTLVVSTPLFIVFILFRKYIMKGVSRSGIKG